MIRFRASMIVLSGAVWAAGLPELSAETPATAPAARSAQTHSVHCYLEITWYPRGFSSPVEDYVLGPRGGFFGARRTDLASLLPAEWKEPTVTTDVLSLTPRGGEQRTLTARLAIETPHLPKMPPDELFRRIGERMLQRLVGRHGAELARIGEKTRAVAKERDTARAGLQGLHKRLVAKQLGDPHLQIRGEKNEILIAELRKQLLKATVERKAKAERLKAIGEQLAKIPRKIPASRPITPDAIAAELQTIASLREKELQRVQRDVKEGVATEAYQDRAKLTLAEAKVELARRREQLDRADDEPDVWMGLRSEQAATEIDLREIEARSAELTRQVRSTGKTGEELAGKLRKQAADRMAAEQIIRTELAVARARYGRAVARVDEIQKELENRPPPTVTVREASDL